MHYIYYGQVSQTVRLADTGSSYLLKSKCSIQQHSGVLAGTYTISPEMVRCC